MNTPYPSQVSVHEYPALPEYVGAHTCRKGDWIREKETGKNFYVASVARHDTRGGAYSSKRGTVTLKSEDGQELTVADNCGGILEEDNPAIWSMAKRFSFLPREIASDEFTKQVGDLIDLAKKKIGIVVGAADARTGDTLVCTTDCSASYPGYSSGIDLPRGYTCTVVSAEKDSVIVRGLEKHSIVLTGKNLRNFVRVDEQFCGTSAV